MPEENHVLTKSCAEKVLTAMETALSQVDKPCAFSSALAADIGKGSAPKYASTDVAQKIQTAAAWLEFKSVLSRGFVTKEEFLYFACLADSAKKHCLKPSDVTPAVKTWTPPSTDVYKGRADKLFQEKVSELTAQLASAVEECNQVSKVADWHVGHTESLAKLRKASSAWCKDAKAVNDCLRKLSQVHSTCSLASSVNSVVNPSVWPACEPQHYTPSAESCVLFNWDTSCIVHPSFQARRVHMQVKKQVKEVQEAMQLEHGIDFKDANNMGAALARAIAELT
eukprot:6490910-Amphidinium_carterae.1